VPGASKAIYRFSRLAADDEEYFSRQVNSYVRAAQPCGYAISQCDEKVIFKRAAVKIITGYGCKDYTSEHAQRLYELQFAKNGKKFSFLALTAFKEEGKIVIVKDAHLQGFSEALPLKNYFDGEKDFCGQTLIVCKESDKERALQFADKSRRAEYELDVLRFDLNKIPQGAIVRTVKSGDKFTKFGGGTKSLGDYFTDKKIPVRLRKVIPLIVSPQGEVLAVCGVEISDKIKLDKDLKNVGCIICADYCKL
jgi:tRNA(Ile)-lysidine synthetase-like protein